MVGNLVTSYELKECGLLAASDSRLIPLPEAPPNASRLLLLFLRFSGTSI